MSAKEQVPDKKSMQLSLQPQKFHLVYQGSDIWNSVNKIIPMLIHSHLTCWATVDWS